MQTKHTVLALLPSWVLKLTGNKTEAREAVERLGITPVPGTNKPINDRNEAVRIASQIGYPVMLKPVGGGGGIGMAIVSTQEQLIEAFDATKLVAESAFAIPDVYLEKYIEKPRHIEFQFLVDNYENAICFGERECSIQRRHQKLIEEAPSPAIGSRMRTEMMEKVKYAVAAIGYRNAGTMEFLYSDGHFYFLEINARIQVEHPVTEMVTGVDIVKEQIKIAAGEPISLKQEDVKLSGWSIECRINAENPENDFVPSRGKIRFFLSPGGQELGLIVGLQSQAWCHPFTIPC